MQADRDSLFDQTSVKLQNPLLDLLLHFLIKLGITEIPLSPLNQHYNLWYLISYEIKSLILHHSWSDDLHPGLPSAIIVLGLFSQNLSLWCFLWVIFHPFTSILGYKFPLAGIILKVEPNLSSPVKSHCRAPYTYCNSPTLLFLTSVDFFSLRKYIYHL